MTETYDGRICPRCGHEERMLSRGEDSTLQGSDSRVWVCSDCGHAFDTGESRAKNGGPYPCARLPADDRWYLWCRQVPGSLARVEGGEWMHPDALLGEGTENAEAVYVGVQLAPDVEIPVEYIVGGGMPPSVANRLARRGNGGADFIFTPLED